LLEGLVYGARAGAAASTAAVSQGDSFQAIPLENPTVPQPDEPLDLADIRNSLKSLMWRSAGVWRDGEGLADAQHSIDRWCRYVLNRQLAGPAGWELQNLLTVARLMIDAAILRTESRGVHLRTDFPETDDTHWRKRILLARGLEAVIAP
jgi:L-aspartate oxidase